MSTSVEHPTPTQAAPAAIRETTPEERRRVRLASTIGTTIEFYDFYVYATAAVAVFPFLFFPKSESSTSRCCPPSPHSASRSSPGRSDQ